MQGFAVANVRMQAFFRVDSHPFHAVSTTEGKFRIGGVPPGSYMLEVWHEYFGKKEVRVNLEADSSSAITIFYQDRAT